tara:strand:+ start:2848 stop:4458 length:1611 start_codon:yes stop_codon:yes gene_type:complete
VKNYGYLTKKIGTLKSSKLFLMQTYKDCYNYTMPLRGVGYTNYGSQQSQDSNVSTANIYKANKYDATATDACKQLASFIISNISPSNLRWFDFDIAQDPTIRLDWLDKTADLIWREIHAGNYNSSAYECILDLIIGGQGILFQDMKNHQLHFELWDTSSCYFECTVKGGQVDCVYREYSLTKQQALIEFEGEDIPDAIRTAGDDTNIEFIHAIFPREKGEYGGMKELKPFASIHLLAKGGVCVRESGYDEFPLAIPRWVVIPNSPYAFGPVYEALDDIKTLNQTTKFILQNAEMAICGMYGAVDDGVLNTGSIQVGPRKVIIMAERDNMWSIPSTGDFRISETMQESQRQQVRRSMMVDQLTMPYQQGTTATEINTRTELLRQVTGPVFGRLEEFLQSVIFRAFGLLLRDEKLPPLPEELKDLPQLSIRYVNPLARAQRNIEVQTIQNFEMSLAQTAQVDPSILDVYKWDEGARAKANLMGIPEILMTTDKEFAEIQKQKAESAKQQHDQALQDEIAVKSAGKAQAGKPVEQGVMQ